MGKAEVQRAVEARCLAAGIASSDILAVSHREESGRTIARVSYTWGRTHEMDLGAVEVAVMEDVVPIPDATSTLSMSHAPKTVHVEFETQTEVRFDAPKANPKRKTKSKRKPRGKA